MKEYQQKHVIRTMLYSRVTMVILFLLCILLLRSIMALNDKRIEMNKLRNESQAERDQMEKKVSDAKTKNDAIATPRGLETYIRTTFPVVKQDEGVIVIYDEDKSPVSNVREDLNLWERFAVWWRDHMIKK
ncbi:MAG: hypothetical protein JWN37_899 [Candidatus Nomurabacteria bacterium]|nr:hypothetical protein [Candidatus Nomurabacteria bacterium]